MGRSCEPKNPINAQKVKTGPSYQATDGPTKWGVESRSTRLKMIYPLTGCYAFVHLSTHTTNEKGALLVALCKSSLAEKYGYENVLRAVVDSFNKLQTTTFELDGDKIKFIVGTTSGDNLVLNPLAGLCASFNNFVKYPCRQCKVVQSDYRNCSGPKQFLKLAENLRDESPTLGSHGITKRSPLAHLNGFHLGRDLPGDVLHNFHGGVGKLYFGIAIKSLLRKKIITFDVLQKNYQSIILKPGRHKENPAPTLSKANWLNKAIPEFQGKGAWVISAKITQTIKPIKPIKPIEPIKPRKPIKPIKPKKFSFLKN